MRSMSPCDAVRRGLPQPNIIRRPCERTKACTHLGSCAGSPSPWWVEWHHFAEDSTGFHWSSRPCQCLVLSAVGPREALVGANLVGIGAQVLGVCAHLLGVARVGECCLQQHYESVRR